MLAVRMCAAGVMGLVLLGSAQAETPHIVVGDLGDPARLTVVGAQTFPVDEIKRALQEDLTLGIAAYRTEPLDRFITLLVEKVIDGYRSEGFNDCRVTASADRNQVVLTIIEGLRYRAGRIKVVGCRVIDAAALERRLRTSQSMSAVDSVSDFATGREYPGPNSALLLKGRKGSTSWHTGEYAALDRHSQAGFIASIKESLFEQGRLFADFKIERIADRAKRTIDLLIHFVDEGRPATVDQIIFLADDERNGHDRILSFAGLAKGMLLTDAVLQQARQRMSQSGRFTKAEIKVERPAHPNEPLALVLDLKELENAPLLGEMLSREQEALEKLGQWLHGFSDSQEELVAQFRSEHLSVEVVAAPKVGMLAEARALGATNLAAGPPDWAFLMTDQRVGFYSARRRAKLETGTARSPVWFVLSASLHDVKPNSGDGGKLTFGVGMKESPVQHGHCRLKFLDTPASILALAHHPDSRLTWKGTTLAVSSKETLIEFDAESGRLLAATPFKAEGMAVELRCERGAFEQRLRQLESWTASWANAAEAERPASAALEFICDEAISCLSDSEWTIVRDQLAAWRKAISAGMLTSLDHLVTAASSQKQCEFSVPLPEDYLTMDDDSTEMIRFMFSRCGFHHADQLLPRGSWAWTLWREAMFQLAGKSRHFHDELGREFAHQDAGPLRNLCAALVLRQFGMSIESKVAAREGLAHAGIDDFRRDYLAILSSDTLIGELLRNIAAAMCALNQDEIRHLLLILPTTNVLSAAESARLTVCLSQLRHQGQGPAATAIPRVLDACWDAALEERFKLILTEMAH